MLRLLFGKMTLRGGHRDRQNRLIRAGLISRDRALGDNESRPNSRNAGLALRGSGWNWVRLSSALRKNLR